MPTKSIIETFHPLSATLLLLSLTLTVSCIEPLDIIIDTGQEVLIVEGAITTRPGPHKIRLTRSGRYDGAVIPVTNASVTIRDSEGTTFPLREEIFVYIDPEFGFLHYTSPTAVYTTDDAFSAVVGRTYTLEIRTATGIEYTSIPEKVIPAIEILELTAKFSKVAIPDNKYKTGMEVYTTFQDPVDEQNYYMWKNSGLYKLTSYPDLHVIFPDYGPVIPDPKDCCTPCWISEPNADRSIYILADNNINGNKTTISSAFIVDDSVRYSDKYMVRIEQNSLSREAFQYFKLLQEQLSINGDIFDPAPGTLRGNMINLSNPSENVIGYFRVSAVSIDSMFLTRDMLLEPRRLFQFNDDCREYSLGFATTIPPVFW